MPSVSPTPSDLDPELLERIKVALRRDLKLDPAEPIADDMPLLGGDDGVGDDGAGGGGPGGGPEIDSIDVLLVIGTLEQEFGVSIPDRDVSERAFASVATLTAYVQRRRDAAGESAGDGAPADVPTGGVSEVPLDWRGRLPHGPEFLYVSDVLALRPGEGCRGVWRVAGDEPFLRGHFPGNPLVPGVLIAEALAQIAGLAAATADAAGGVLARVDVKFESPVPPPADVHLEAVVRGGTGTLRLCDVSATVAGTPVASGTIALDLTPESSPT